MIFKERLHSIGGCTEGSACWITGLVWEGGLVTNGSCKCLDFMEILSGKDSTRISVRMKVKRLVDAHRCEIRRLRKLLEINGVKDE